MSTFQDTLNNKATTATWNEIKNTHIDDIKRYLQFVVDDPQSYLKNNDLIEEEQSLSKIDSFELQLIVEKYYKKYLDIINLDLQNVFDLSKKNNKKKKGISKDQIIIKNIKKKVNENKFAHKLVTNLYNFHLNKDRNVCDLINICQELYKYNLKTFANELLATYCQSKEICDLDNILNNLEIWKKKHVITNFELTHCQKSIIQYLLNYFENKTISNSMLEMSNTGSGKTVGIIIALALIWKYKLYNSCISYTYNTYRTRRHSVKFPTQMVIAVLPCSVISFVQSALTSLNVPWCYVTPTSTAIIYEFDPTLVINYSEKNRNKLKHFTGLAPAIYLTTETPSLNESILSCIKAYYKNVYSHIEKQQKQNIIKFISYNNKSNKLEYGKTGLVYSKYKSNWIYSLIGDDMEMITPFTHTRNILSDNILTIVTTATPTGLSKTLEGSELILPNNIDIPLPQDEVRNCGGVLLTGENGDINILMIAYLNLFKQFDINDEHITYKWSMVLYSFMNGIFERKYLIPFLNIICSKLSSKIKDKILNRKMFFDGTVLLNIDSICCYIIKILCKILRSKHSKYILKILNKLVFNENNLFTMETLKKKIFECKNRGILLCSPTFIQSDTYKDHEYISAISDENFELNEVNNKLREYYIELEKYERNISDVKVKSVKNKITDDSKNYINQCVNDEIDQLPKPKFDEKYQIYSKKHFKLFNVDETTFAKINIDELQLKTAYIQNDVKLAQGILSINPQNTKKLDMSLKLYTHGNDGNIRAIQFLTNIFNTRQLILGANPPTKLNIIIANYNIIIKDKYAIIESKDGIAKYPVHSVYNLLIQICGRISRGVQSESGIIYTTNSVSEILISNTPKSILYNQIIQNIKKVKCLKKLI